MGESDPLQLESFVSPDQVDALIGLAKREDLGPHDLDVTCHIMIDPQQRCQAAMVSRQTGTLAGASLLKSIAAAYDQTIDIQLITQDGQPLTPNQTVARFTGSLGSVLAMERVALNFVCHLSGIATLTAAYVHMTVGTKARIYDTRKTLPGWRGLAKYAVACGGGASHRIGLYDAMLIKDNHLAHLAINDLRSAVAQAVNQARREHRNLQFVEVEVDSIEQLRQVIDAGIDIVLLDNMNATQLREAVAVRDELAPHVELEASGNVNLDTVASIAATGVERISVGALTHSATALDLGLDIK